MKKRIIVCLIPLVFSCGGEENPNESVDFDEFAGQTGVLDGDTLQTDLDTTIDLSSEIGRFTQAMSTTFDTLSSTQFHVIDRFSYSQAKKVQFKANYEVSYGKTAKVTPTADFFYYTFADSLKTNNAFYNYLDAIAEEGEGGPVKLNQDVKAIKSVPLFMVVYDTVIVSAIYKCEHEANDWSAFQDSLLKIYGNKYRYQIEIECGGPLSWK